MASLLTRGELASACRATAQVAAGGATPDPFKFDDLLTSADATVDVAMRRIAAAETPRVPALYRWPKDDDSSRVMTYLDPIDEVIYRAAVGRFVRQLEARIDRDHVLAARPARGWPFWRLEPHGGAISKRTELALTWLDEPAIACMGTIDIKDYFYDVTPTALAVSLARIPGPAPSKGYLTRWIRDVGAATGVAGLPVGHQPSAVLGNYLLRVGDQLLGPLLHAWLRYMDDTWVFVRSDREAVGVRDAYADAVGRLHLRVNGDKWEVRDADAAREFVRSSLNDYVETTLQEGESDSEDARRLFDFAAEAPKLWKRELRRSLTLLAKRSDAHAVDRLHDQPHLFAVAPEQWSNYLVRLFATKSGRRAVDSEWLVEVIRQPRSGHDDAERLVMLRVLGHAGQPSKAAGQLLFDMALDPALPPPVGVRAAAAWGRAKGWKLSRAVEAATEVPDLGVKRALVATMKPHAADAGVGEAVQRLRLLDSDLEPTLRWIAA